MFDESLGMCGKMGKVLSLYRMYSETDEIEWKIQAEELLEKVLSQCNNITSLSYRSGLLGIGTGVEWLFQQGFLCGSRDVILEDIDILAMKSIIKRRIPNVDKMDGLTGLVTYLFYRLHYRKDKETLIVLTLKEHTLYLIDWIIEEVQNSDSEYEIYGYYFALVILHRLDIFNAKIENVLQWCNCKVQELKLRK